MLFQKIVVFFEKPSTVIIPCEVVLRFSFMRTYLPFFQHETSVDGILCKLTAVFTFCGNAQICRHYSTRITGVSQIIENKARAKEEKNGKFPQKVPIVLPL